MEQRSVRNLLLSHMLPTDFSLLAQFLEPVELTVGFELESANKTIPWVYFPENGIAAVLAVSRLGKGGEVDLLGREGMSGLALVLRSNCWPYATIVQTPMRALRIASKPFQDALNASPSLRQQLLSYSHCAMIQVCQTALAHGVGSIRERLARLLLMCQDRLEDSKVPLTHEVLAGLLGVRRATVSEALSVMEVDNLTKGVRGVVIVMDRPGLLRLAGLLYGVPEAEYTRVIGEAAA